MERFKISDSTIASAESVLSLNFLRARKNFEKLESWLLSKHARSLPEHEVEIELERRGREVHRLMLQAHLEQRGTGHVGTQVRVIQENGFKRNHKPQRVDARKVVSLFGEVPLKRTAYVAPGQASVHPLDEELHLPERSFSYALQQRVVEEAVRGPFDEVVESLKKTTGNEIAKRSAEQMVRDAAVDFDAFYDQRVAPPPEKTGALVVGSVDGKGVPLVKPETAKRIGPRRTKGEKANKKKMATVATVFTQPPRIRTPEQVVESLFEDKTNQEPHQRPEHKRVWASLEKDKENVIEAMALEMHDRDPNHQKKSVVVTDGERALQQRVKRSLPRALLILDFFHASERLWKTAHALVGEGSQKAHEWVRDHALMLLQGNVSQVVKGMRQSVTKRKLRGEKRKTILDAANYFYRNRRQMRYQEYLAQGLPIASGAVEGACKNLVKDRMERSGMRWQVDGAEAMLKLRAIKLSGDMEEYWPFHIQQEQNRIYGKIRWKAA